MHYAWNTLQFHDRHRIDARTGERSGVLKYTSRLRSAFLLPAPQIPRGFMFLAGVGALTRFSKPLHRIRTRHGMIPLPAAKPEAAWPAWDG